MQKLIFHLVNDRNIRHSFGELTFDSAVLTKLQFRLWLIENLFNLSQTSLNTLCFVFLLLKLLFCI
jgi:hypothetical protein